ncbi:MAG: VWA domain-containing protein, partial [Candidatus Omnitrophica bacterium]|nr:VWA domain-containing protein [Candidatus Omnitrophota bacterium]
LITELRIRFEQLAPPDVELFSMLFPLLFSSDPKRYLKEGLLSWLLLVKDKDSSYCQSAKGILNAFLRILKAKDKSIQFSEITDDFEEDRINAITDLILKLAPEKIKWYAALVYTNAYEKKFKGDYYLNTTKKGKYKRIERGTIRGDSIFEITEGEILQPPDVETEDLPDSKKVDIEQKIKIKSDVQNKEERGKTERDIERVGMPGKGEGKKPADIQRIKGSWVEEYVRVFSRYAQRIIEVFSQEPEVEERYSKSGRTIDLKRYLLGLQNIFKRRFYLDSRPALCFGITVDVSGSITGNPTLVNSFTQLARFYLSLMFKLASLYRQGVYYGLSAIGENFHPGLKFSNRHTQETLEDLVYGNDYRWMINFNDGGGINTINLIQGLREKWQDASLPEENRIEIIFTDGQETSGSGEEHFRYLRKLVSDFERDTKVKVIFVGIGTPEVRNYTRYIELSSQPNPEEFIRIIVRLGEMLTQKGRLPEGDLAEALQVEHKPASVKQASVVASQKGEEDLAKKANLDFTNQQVFTDLSGFAFQDGHYQILNDGSVRIGEEVIRVGEGGLLYPVRVYEAQPDWFER